MFERARPKNNVGRILIWIGLWPWSMLAWALRDPVKMVYDMLTGVFEAIYDRHVGRLEKQFQAVFANQSQNPEEK